MTTGTGNGGREGTGEAEQGRAGPGRAGPGRAGHASQNLPKWIGWDSWVEQGMAKQGQGSARAGQGRAE